MEALTGRSTLHINHARVLSSDQLTERLEEHAAIRWYRCPDSGIGQVCASCDLAIGHLPERVRFENPDGPLAANVKDAISPYDDGPRSKIGHRKKPPRGSVVLQDAV
ncbi:hypothetical protein BSZ36_05860 [Rubricoccus marinus]|uniref:Uncharacterized protein n=1 Tax=Rubricoccus marinus TaxID=716817 RepID=A0A259TXR1_9BACT|nr:hypothetical protein BSZ36_05860 [Rubricoccus marinus]